MTWSLIHIFIWVAGYSIINLSSWTVGAFTAGSAGYWWVSAYGTLINAILFYGHANFLLPRLLNRKHWWGYLLATVTLLLGLSVLETGLDILCTQSFAEAYLSGFRALFHENLLTHSVFFLFFSFVFRFGKDWFAHQRLQRQLKEEKLNAELSLLKAQVNPHFLFNTLNNLFASAQQSGDEQTASGIAKLAGIMRYMLSESEVKEVSLKKEVRYLEDYVALQKLRFADTDPIRINFEKQGDLQKQIVPLLLIPFVENAFKHGIRFHTPSFVDIHIEVTDKQLNLRVNNTVHAHSSTPLPANHGIGLNNVRKRLAIHYPTQHQLNISETEKDFTVDLQITLSPISHSKT